MHMVWVLFLEVFLETKCFSAKVFPIESASGVVYAFDVEAVYFSRRSLRRILLSVPGVSHLERSIEVEGSIYKFMYRGKNCMVWEPYGDNSRYWVGQDDKNEDYVDFTDVLEAFKSYQPPFLVRVVGGLLSFRIFP